MNNRRITKEEVVRNLINLKQLTFEVTDDCNLQCKYCGYGELYSGYDARATKYMTFEQIKELLDFLMNLWKTRRANSTVMPTYISFYGGEPLLNMPFIRQTIEYIENCKLQRNIVFSMTTNAILLDRNMDYLVAKNFHLLISLDGDKEGHSYRVDKAGRNSFERVFRNVKALKEKYPAFFAANVNFNAVLHNKNSVQRTHEFIQKEFDKTPAITELNTSDIRPDKIEEFNKTYRNKLESLHQAENYEKLSEELFMNEPSTYDLLLYLHHYSGNVFRDYRDLFTNPATVKYTPTGTCSPFGKKMFVTVNGKVIPCEKIAHDFAMGHVSEKGLDLNIDSIVIRYNGYLDKLQGQCSSCYRKKSCIQCLYYIENIEKENPVCQGFMDEKAFNRYLSYCLGHLAKNPKLYRQLMKEVMVE